MFFSQPCTSCSGVGDASNGRSYTPQVFPQWPVALLWLAQGRRHCVLGYSTDEGGEQPYITEWRTLITNFTRLPDLSLVSNPERRNDCAIGP